MQVVLESTINKKGPLTEPCNCMTVAMDLFDQVLVQGINGPSEHFPEIVDV